MTEDIILDMNLRYWLQKPFATRYIIQIVQYTRKTLLDPNNIAIMTEKRQ